MIDLNSIDASHTPCMPIAPMPSPPALQKAPEMKPYSIHVPLLAATLQPVMLAGDPTVLLRQIDERLRYDVTVILPDGQECPMYAAPAIAEKSDTDVTIPVVLCCRISPGQKVNDVNLFAKGLIDTLNELMQEYGCALTRIEPRIITAAPHPLSDPI